MATGPSLMGTFFVVVLCETPRSLHALLAACWVDGLVNTPVPRFDEISPASRIFIRAMWRTDLRRNPKTRTLSLRSGEGKSRPDTPPTRARIAIKGYLTRTSIAAQEGNHCFDCGLFVEILSGLGQ